MRLQTLHPSVSAPLASGLFFPVYRKCPFRPNLREIVYFTIKSIYNVKKNKAYFYEVIDMNAFDSKLLDGKTKLHFVGIGGGMFPLVQILHMK